MRDFHTISGEMRELRVVDRHLATTKEESHGICGTHAHAHTHKELKETLRGSGHSSGPVGL